MKQLPDSPPLIPLDGGLGTGQPQLTAGLLDVNGRQLSQSMTRFGVEQLDPVQSDLSGSEVSDLVQAHDHSQTAPQLIFQLGLVSRKRPADGPEQDCQSWQDAEPHKGSAEQSALSCFVHQPDPIIRYR